VNIKVYKFSMVSQCTSLHLSAISNYSPQNLKASVWLNALVLLCPDILQAPQAAWEPRTTDAKFVRQGKPDFAAIPAESVDFAGTVTP
jgi:hypothetical protein